MKRFACIYNPESGTAKSADEITSAFSAAGAEVECFAIQKGKDALLAAISKEEYAGVVAAGGDGTVNMVAQLAVELGLPLGVLPVGTLNHFAKDLGLPLSFEEAVQAVCTGRTKPVDYSTVNNRLFLNNASIGIYPSVVLDRDGKDYVSKLLATTTSFIAALFRDHTVRADITCGDLHTTVRSPLLFIGNNIYELERVGFTKRNNMQSGKMLLYIVKATRTRALILLALLSLFGMRRRHADILRETSKSITIRIQRKDISVAVDGEVVRLECPLVFATHPGGLQVITSQ